MKIGVYNAAWCNIGNGFFAGGLIAYLRRFSRGSTIFELDEPHPYCAPQKLMGHVFPLAQVQDADIYVFTGPILAQIRRFGFGEIIRKIVERGKQYAILSASASEMCEAEVSYAVEVMSKYRPLAFATRDHETYERFQCRLNFCHDGICCAFLIPYIQGVPDVVPDKKYFVSSFYKSPEPYFDFNGDERGPSVKSISVRKRSRIFGGIFPLKYSRHLEFLRKDYPSKVGGLTVVRAHQGFNPAMKFFNYAAPNSFVSYNPLSYLSIYKGCEFTISDRVHACAATLAYGHPARLLDINDRMGIFNRMGYKRDPDGVMLPISQDQYGKNIAEFGKYLADRGLMG